MLTVNLDSAVPLIDQLVRGLRHAIAAGTLEPGSELPPVRQLANDLGINLNTVARAYRMLEARGLVRAARGRGTRVTASRERAAADPPQRKARLAEELRAVLADAKLAGMDRAALERMIDRQLDTLWPS